MRTGGSTSSGGGGIYYVTVFAGETAEQRARAYFAALAADFEGNPLRAAQALDRRMIAAINRPGIQCWFKMLINHRDGSVLPERH